MVLGKFTVYKNKHSNSLFCLWCLCAWHLSNVAPLVYGFIVNKHFKQYTSAYGPAQAQPPLAWIPNTSFRTAHTKLWCKYNPDEEWRIMKEKIGSRGTSVLPSSISFSFKGFHTSMAFLKTSNKTFRNLKFKQSYQPVNHWLEEIHRILDFKTSSEFLK